jgi:hypothetical protein
MKTTKLIVLAATAMLAMAACRKDKTTATLNPASEPTSVKMDESSLKPIPQKMYPVTGAEAIKIVKRFKHLDESNPNNAQARLIEADSVLLDSATFVMEATLNYDFDYNRTNADEVIEDLPIETTAFTIPKSRLNNKISSKDLEAVYQELTTFVNSQLDPTKKIAIIDIEAYQVGTNQVTFKAIPRIIRVLVQSYWCGTNIYSGYASLTSNSTPLAYDNINYFLRNCDFPLTACQGNFYISAQTFPNSNQLNAFPNALYYAFWPQSITNPVYSDPTNLSASQINTRRANCVALAQSGLSTLSSSYKVVVISITHALEMYNTFTSTGMPIPAGFKRVYWNLPTTYGIPVGC